MNSKKQAPKNQISQKQIKQKKERQGKIKKVLIIGSAALKIGEAGEFDYSGSQAIKALKSEGIKTVLINPNIATIQTSADLADKLYLLPIQTSVIEEIIKKEKKDCPIDSILLSFGGQTALNCGLALEEQGILKKYNIKVLGTSPDTIRITEDRKLFNQQLAEIGVKYTRSQAVNSTDKALKAAEKINYPVMVRIAFALGGLGSGVCRNPADLKKLTQDAFHHTNQVLIEEYLQGWKEVEYEVVRDCYDNCITVCNMENLDPLGIHTGESIVIAPSQTLSNQEYFDLREIAIKCIRHLKVVGECNIQYALHPKTGDYRIIEVNARLSRSSALASKATGYPLAYIAAKLSLGYALNEIENSVTKKTQACFEPSLDYVVVKMPRWDLKKFQNVTKKLGSSMKSVGEVMAISRSFKESLQKAIRMLDLGFSGFVEEKTASLCSSKAEIIEELKNPTDERIYILAQAFLKGMSLDEIHQYTFIDKWFLAQLEELVYTYQKIKKVVFSKLKKEELQEFKNSGFSDFQIAQVLKTTEKEVRNFRYKHKIHPAVKQIDTLAGEYPAQTNYLYLTYNASEDDVESDNKKTIITLGSGCYRIGSSVEFDWCCVNAAKQVTKSGYCSVLINFNPETVSTDYDLADRLYFDEISLENVLEIYRKEKADGVIVSMGGQTANNLVLALEKAGVKILGTPATQIDRAEDRHKFSSMLDKLQIRQPHWTEVKSNKAAFQFAKKVSYPVLVRPSYVLSGAAMGVATSDKDLGKFLDKSALVSPDYPVVISQFLEESKEIEFDAVACKGEIIVFAISEHVENAGVHSGDATLVLPPQRLYIETLKQVETVAKQIAANLQVTGPLNIQFLAKENKILVIECNLRASRSFPFVSKVTKINFIDLATRAILGGKLEKEKNHYLSLGYVGVKASQFSFTRLSGADPTLGVEMASTGEVGCLGEDFYEALLKSLTSVGIKLNLKKVLLSSGPEKQKHNLLASCQKLQSIGVKIYATWGTQKFLEKYGVKATSVSWPDRKKKDNVLTLIEKEKLDLIVNIPKNFQEKEITNDYKIRRKAVDSAVPLITNGELFIRYCGER